MTWETLCMCTLVLYMMILPGDAAQDKRHADKTKLGTFEIAQSSNVKIQVTRSVLAFCHFFNLLCFDYFTVSV